MNRALSVLVVDDNDLDVERIQRSIRRLALDVDLVRAVDGLDALDYLRSPRERDRTELPALILLDLNMPRMTGSEFLECVGADPELADVPIVIVSTSSRPGDIELARSQGAIDYIVKPLLDDRLSALISWVRAERAS